MSARKRIPLLILIMAIVAIGVGGVAIFALYGTAIEQQRERLVETAQSQARLIESMARFGTQYASDEFPGGTFEAIVSQIREAHDNFNGFGESGEFTLARYDHESDQIIFLLSHRHHDTDNPEPVPFSSELAEPMRQALSNESGSLTGLDYRGVRVLAAYEPVDIGQEFDLGIVAKIDMVEVREPFIRTGLLAGGGALLLILLGMVLFLNISNPLIQRIEESEARYRSLTDDVMDTSVAGILILDKDFRIVWVNQALERSFGLQRTEIIGRDNRQLIREQVKHIFENAEGFEQKVVAAFDNNTYTENFECHVLPDGESKERWLEHWSHPIQSGLYAGGRIEHYADVTERKRAEEALARERDLLHSLMDNIPDYIYFKDADSRFTRINESQSAMLGVDAPEAAIGKRDFDYFPPEIAEDAYADEQKIVKTGQPLIGKIEKVRHADGQFRWLSVTKVPIKDAEGKVTGIVGVSRDVTERKKAQDALAKEHNLLSVILENLPLDVYVKDTDSRFVLANASTMRGLRVTSPEEYIGKTDFDFMAQSPEIAERCFAEEQAIIQTGKPMLNNEQSGIGPDGRRRWNMSSKLPLRDAEGNITGIVGLGMDTTERKRAELALRENEELYRNLYETALVGMWRSRISDGMFIRSNDANAKIIGYESAEDIVGKHRASEFYPAEQRAELLKQLEEHGEVSGFEAALTLDDGTEKTISISAKVFPDKGYLEGVVVDITERKLAEEALRKSEELYRNLYETPVVGLSRTRLSDGMFIRSNDANARLFGYDSAEEIIGKRHVSEFYPAERRAEFLELIKEHGEVSNFEAHLTLDDGTERTIAISAKISPDGDHAEGAVIDITERKRAEEAVRASEELLRAFVNTLPDIALVIDEDGRYVEILSAPEGLFLGVREDMLGRLIPEALPEEVARQHMAALRRTVETDELQVLEYPLDVPVGRRWFEGRISLMQGTNNGKKLVVWIARDITERKRAEDALRQERNLLQTLIDTMPDYIFIKDAPGRFLLVNKQGVIGRGRETVDEVIGKTDFDFTNPERAEKIRVEEQALIRSGESLINQEEEVLFETGKRRWFITTKVPFRDSEGNIVGLLGVSRDITERKRLEAESMQTEILRAELEKEKELGELKERFARTVSHQFRQPLTVMRTYSYLMQGFDRLPPDRRGEIVQQFEDQIDRMTGLIDGTLALSRGQAGKIEFNPEALDLEPFCRNIFDQAIIAAEIPYKFEFVSRPPKKLVMVDSKLLQEVLSNLLSNATKYSPEGGAIRFELDHDQEMTIFRVGDEGLGIPGEDLPRMFTPFHRADNVSGIQGTGLGLAIAKQYVEMHKGTIEVDSVIGEGSTFTVSIPL